MTTSTADRSRVVPGGKLNRLLIGLLLLQLAILAISRLTASPPTVAKPHKLFADLDTAKVNAIRIQDENKKVVELTKRGGSWVLASAGGYPTKKDKVSDLLSKLPGLTAGPPVSEQATHQRELEVAEDKFQREVTLSREGGEPIRFFLGSSPGLKRVHLRFAGQKPIYAAEELSAWDVGTAAYDWVETEYFKLERKEIVAVTVNNEHGEIRLTRGGEGEDRDRWQLAGLVPGKDKLQLKQSEVDSLLSAASAVTLQDPVGTELEPAHGLDKPLALVTVVTEKVIEAGKDDEADKGDKADEDDEAGKGDKADRDRSGDEAAAASQPAERRERRTYTLKIGAKKDDVFYAKASTSDFVVTVGSWIAESFINKKPADFKEKPDTDKKDKQGQAGEHEDERGFGGGGFEGGGFGAEDLP